MVRLYVWLSHADATGWKTWKNGKAGEQESKALTWGRRDSLSRSLENHRFNFQQDPFDGTLLVGMVVVPHLARLSCCYTRPVIRSDYV